MKLRINGNEVTGGNKYLATVLLSCFSSRFRYQSFETIQGNTMELLSFFSKGLDNSLKEVKSELELKNNKNLKRKITFCLKSLSKITEKEKLIKAIYNFLLSLDGLSTLPGFGMTNRFKDDLKINPEKQTIYENI